MNQVQDIKSFRSAFMDKLIAYVAEHQDFLKSMPRDIDPRIIELLKKTIADFEAAIADLRDYEVVNQVRVPLDRAQVFAKEA